MRDTPSQKFLGIQALRVVAACLVVVTHSTFYAFERLDKSFPVWGQGTRGVDIFFVISGFVMICSSQKLFGLPNAWKVFAEHRVVRIVPLYWLLTTVKVLLVTLTAGLALHTALNPASTLCSYLFLPARNLDGRLEPLVGVGWTLNFEMLFYLLFTVALFLRTNVLQFVGGALVLLSFGALFRPFDGSPMTFYFNSIVLEFLMGMLIAKACIHNLFIGRKYAAALLVCGFILLLLPPADIWGLPKALISGLPASLIVWSVASLRRLDNAIPSWVLYLGNASYAIYLIHPFVCPLPPAFLHRLHIESPKLSVYLSVALGLGAGCLLHQFIELPMTRRLKAYLNARRGLIPVVA